MTLKTRVTLPSLKRLAAEIEQMSEGPDKETLRKKVAEMLELQGAISDLNKAIREVKKREG